jgi:hypothetical protein
VKPKKTTKTTKTPAALPQPWRIHFFQRHAADDPSKGVPGREFLGACPDKVKMTMLAVLKAVADAPPPQFSGGGKWKAMHGSMAGYHEVTVNGPNRHHYRLFCLLERDGGALGLGGPSLVVLAGLDKAFMTTLSENDYAKVRALGDEYRARSPRSVQPPKGSLPASS